MLPPGITPYFVAMVYFSIDKPHPESKWTIEGKLPNVLGV